MGKVTSYINSAHAVPITRWYEKAPVRTSSETKFGSGTVSKLYHYPKFAVPTLALPTNVAFSSTISRGASMSPRSAHPAWSSQRSDTKTFPSTVPCTFTDFVLISPRINACSPSVSVPVDWIVPSTSPSMRSSFRNWTEPLIETPREKIARRRWHEGAVG
jgi:hypothetical protein